MENGTHAEETNADGNLDDSIVMPLLLFHFPPHAFFLLTASNLFLSIQNKTITLRLDLSLNPFRSALSQS